MKNQSLPSACGVAVAAAVWAAGAVAQSYPAKPVTVIVTAAPGGNADVETRRYTSRMAELLGQPFVIDFKLGAGGTVGAAHVARSAPDGYTLLAATGSFTTFPVFYPKLPFDTLKDFAPVSLMAQRATVLMVQPRFPAQNFTEYLAYAKANPGKVNFATSGSGGVIHLAAAWLHNATDTKVTYIHYKGQAPALTDLMAGRVDVATGPAPTALAMAKAGKLRVLAIMGNQHSRVLPGVKHVAEQGVAQYNYASWHGYIAPAATSPATVAKLSEAFAVVAKNAELVKMLEPDGVALIGSTPSQFRQFIVDETMRWRKVVAENDIKYE